MYTVGIYIYIYITYVCIYIYIRAIVGLLREHDVEFEHFDILQVFF